MNDEMDLNLEKLSLDLKLNYEELLIVRGSIAEIDGLSVGEIEAKQETLRGSLMPSDKDYRAKSAALVMMQNVVMQLKGQDPIESHDTAYLNLTEVDAREDAEQLRAQGFPEVATQMETSINGLNADGIAEQERRNKLLAKSNEQLTSMKEQQIKDEKASQDEVSFHNRANASRA